MVERAIGGVSKILRRFKFQKGENFQWLKYLSAMQFAINTTPFLAKTDRQPASPLEHTLKSKMPKLATPELRTDLRKVYQNINTRIRIVKIRREFGC